MLSMDGLHAAAMVRVAEAWMGMGRSHASKAVELLEEALVQILGHGGAELRGRCHLAMATCLMAGKEEEECEWRGGGSGCGWDPEQ